MTVVSLLVHFDLLILKICSVPRMHKHFGDRSLSAASLHLWNTLPNDFRQAEMSYEPQRAAEN